MAGIILAVPGLPLWYSTGGKFGPEAFRPWIDTCMRGVVRRFFVGQYKQANYIDDFWEVATMQIRTPRLFFFNLISSIPLSWIQVRVPGERAQLVLRVVSVRAYRCVFWKSAGKYASNCTVGSATALFYVNIHNRIHCQNELSPQPELPFLPVRWCVFKTNYQ